MNYKKSKWYEKPQGEDPFNEPGTLKELLSKHRFVSHWEGSKSKVPARDVCCGDYQD